MIQRSLDSTEKEGFNISNRRRGVNKEENIEDDQAED